MIDIMWEWQLSGRALVENIVCETGFSAQKLATESVKTKVFARETVSKAWWIISTMHIIASRCLATLLLLGLCYHPDNVFFLKHDNSSEGWCQELLLSQCVYLAQQEFQGAASET